VLIFVVLGPVFGAIGHLCGWPILLWLGAALALVNLGMDVASGVMKFPILPLAFVVVAALMLPPWWYGSALGLLAWTMLEALGMLYGRLRLKLRH
jgi:hypothetical protein